MELKVEVFKGVEYHFPASFKNAEEYVASIQPPQISSDAAKAMKWNEVRIKRDRLIAATDWTQTLDCPLSDEKKAEFVAYRQTLRDIPQNVGNPDDVVWPTKPTI